MRKWLLILLLFTSSSLLAAPPSISDFTKSMTENDGYIPFFYDASDDKIYLSLSRLDTPFLLQTSLSQGVGSNDIGLDRGQLGGTHVVVFERHGNKVLLKQQNTRYRSDSDNAAELASIDAAFADSVLAGFKVVAESGDTVLIDYTPYLLSDVHGISERLARTKQGTYKVDTSRSAVFLPRSKAFLKNTELESIVTFGGNNPGEYVQQVTPEADSITVHLHHSFVDLPDDNYEPRAYHPYSGYWKRGYFDYATAITEPTEVKFISRHRLYKKDVDAKVSEPVEPIVYYLDPGIPEPVMSALKDGASWWNQAFEAIGYKDAFQVKVLPEGADAMDIRYNMINWVHRATRGWSYGSSVVDPRTGEIIKGNVTLGSLRVRQDFLIALGLTSPFVNDADNVDAQSEMALARIRQLAAHEVGHTLGLAHNFAASESKTGRESVMDYPHPKITIKNGKISLEDAYDTGMGEWDKHMIAYGYQDYASDEEEKAGLKKLIAETRASGLKFKNDWDTRSPYAPSSNGHMWDNGGDPLDAYDEIVAIRKEALKNFGLNSIAKGSTLSSLEDVLVPIYLLHRYQLQAVSKQVGGLDYKYELKGQYSEPEGVKMVTAETQKRAIKQLLTATSADFLQLPDDLLSLIPPTAFGDDVTREQFKSRMGLAFDPASAAESAANYSFSLLLHPERLNRLNWQASKNRAVPNVQQLIERILDLHWYSSKTDYGLNGRLRMVALNAIIAAAEKPELAPEAKFGIETALYAFFEWLDDSKMPGAKLLEEQMDVYFKTGKWPGAFEPKALPPGSPI